MSTNEHPEWNEWSRRPYVVEIGRQCSFALRAADELREALLEQGFMSDAAAYFAQVFLGAVANVSKLFDPQPRTSWAPERGRRLRELFEVQDDSPILDRDVRNHFEHIDDRIDEWVLAQPQLTAEQVEAGELGALAAAPPPPLRVIRREDGVIAVRDDQVNIPEVVAELRRVQAIAREIEPLANTAYPALAEFLAALPFFPSELRLSAPTRRPDEPVTAGAAAVPDMPPLEDALRDAIYEAAEYSKQESGTKQGEATETSSNDVR